MDNNIKDDDIITLVEETEPKKVKKKRTYEQQKERIKNIELKLITND
jgi:hypothetical protein